MKNKKRNYIKTIGLIVFIGIILAQSNLLGVKFASNNPDNYETNNVSEVINQTYIPKKAANHDPIYIDGNAELDAFCFGNGTDGTKFNPHVIQDLVIDCHNLENSFTIINTDKYLDIVNCTFFNGEDFAGLYINNCKNIWVEDAIIFSQHYGIELRGAEDITILTCFLHDNYGAMIIQGGNYNTIYGNQVWDNTVYGIYLFSAPNNTLKFNYIHDNYRGFYLKYSDDNFFQYNTLNHIRGDGFYLYNSDFNEFADNEVEYNYEYFYDCSGFNLENSHNNLFHENIVKHNQDPGFRVEDSSNNTIENNEIIDNYCGIYLRDSYDIKIINNTILEENGDGISVRSSYDIEIIDNTILRTNWHGIELYYSYNTQIINNTSSENRYHGLRFYYVNSCVIEHNEFNENEYGLDFWYSNDSILYHNWCLLNRDGGFRFTDTNNIVFINSPPEIVDIKINPDIPCRNEDLLLSYKFQDCEDDLENGTEIRWYKNNILQPVFNNQKVISGTITNVDDLWNVTIKPKDGTLFGFQKNYSVVIIDNDRPIVTNVFVNNNSLRAGFSSNLILNYTYFDIGGDLEGEPIISWYRNNESIGPNNTTPILESYYTIEGDIWKASIQVFDGISYGLIAWSNEIEINHIPEIFANIIRNSPFSYGALSIHINLYDEDGDEGYIINESIRWFVDGVLRTEFNGINRIDSSYISIYQQWYVEFSFSDGYDNISYITEEITIINQKPEVYSLNINPVFPTLDDDLVVSYNYFDADSHPENETLIRWYLNDSLQEIYNDLKSVPKSALYINDIWKVTVQPYDGYDFGDIYESNSVTINKIDSEEDDKDDDDNTTDSNKISGFPFQFTGSILIMSVIGIVTVNMKRIK